MAAYSETQGNILTPTPFLRAGYGADNASSPNKKRKDQLPASDKTRLKTAKEWENELLFQMRPKSKEPLKTTEVKQSELITDVRTLFGQDLKGKVSLRTAEDHKQGRPINLVQFHPNFQPGKVVCRHPDCKNVKPDDGTGEGKRDLYLCPDHLTNLNETIKKMCADKKVNVEVSLNPEERTFDGYTSMIGHLDHAYCNKKTSPLQSLGWGIRPLVNEAILNVRNYLMIVNAVLNPEEKNLGIALPPVFEILKLILQKCNNLENTRNLVHLLQVVVGTILFSFGVLYHWVSVALSSAGAQIGAGIGGLFGSVVGFFGAGPAGAAVGGVGGAALGGLIGNGISKLILGQPQDADCHQASRGVFSFKSSILGDFEMRFELQR